MLARPPWERKCGHVGYVEFWHREQRVVDLRHVELGGCVRDLELWNQRQNDAIGLGGGYAGRLNVGGEGTSVLGMLSFGTEKIGMSGTLMSGTGKTTASGTTLTSLGRMWQGTMVRRQQCPILALTLAPSLALPIAAVAIARCHSQGRGRPEDVIATAKTPSPPPPSTDIAARPLPPLKTTTSISTQPLQRPSTSPLPQLSPLASPLHLLQPLLLLPWSSLPLPLPPPPMPPPPHPHPFLRCHYRCNLRQRHCTSDAPVDGWLCVVFRSSPAALSAVQICQPPPPVVRSSTSTTTAITAVDDCHRHCHG
jgi:hypothetical protein